MEEKRIWEIPEICVIGVEETTKNNDGQQPNDVWCGKHNKWHGNNHSS